MIPILEDPVAWLIHALARDPRWQLIGLAGLPGAGHATTSV
jgi:hypothetical protein